MLQINTFCYHGKILHQQEEAGVRTGVEGVADLLKIKKNAGKLSEKIIISTIYHFLPCALVDGVHQVLRWVRDVVHVDAGRGGVEAHGVQLKGNRIVFCGKRRETYGFAY